MNVAWRERLRLLPSSGTGLAPVDLLLSGLASAVAVYAGALSLSSDKNGLFFLWVVLGGTVTSLAFLALWGTSKAVYADATAYTAVAVVSFFGISTLNLLVPDPIYTGPLGTAGILSWMIVLGSFTVWRDQTMLFQAVPAVALFGLVGCYDTFHESVIYFFIFLVCQATLLARAHGRTMLRQARSTGVEALEISDMRKGPWKWMAGPEWALGSALAIVLLSAIGAPILRESAQSFSGLVSYTPPASPLSAPAVAAAGVSGTAVGQGPNQLSAVPVLRVELPQPMYLRSFVFGAYSRGSWYPRRGGDELRQVLAEARRTAADEIKDRRLISFRIEPLLIYNGVVSVPGEVTTLATDSMGFYYRNFGDSFSTRSSPPYPVLQGEAVIYDGKSRPTDSDREIAAHIKEYLSTDGIPQDVAAFARTSIQGARTDWAKAAAIKSAIEADAKYNLLAPRTPAGADPVSYFLFTSKQGYCDVFASSMTLMARSVGLPARYVTGYYPFDEPVDEDGRMVVRQKDAHAWCEIYFKNAGWVIFDATENAEVIGEGRGASTDVPFWRTGWFLVVASFTGLAGLGYGGLRALRFLRPLLSFTPERKSSRERLRLRSGLSRQFRSYERELRDAARRPRAASETLLEFTRAAEAGLGSRASLAWDTSAAFLPVLYGQRDLEASQLAQLKQMVDTFRSARGSSK